ncbi:MAG: hypothetical protein IKS15_04060 [Opitutales bacterium]|nr:hypothetical protein [Opitutales bacterium]
MKKKLIFTAFLIVVAAQFFFPLKTVHDQYMAKKYGTEEFCDVELYWVYKSEIGFNPSDKNAKFKSFKVKDEEILNFVGNNRYWLTARAAMKVLGNTRALEDVLVCGVSMKNPPDNALEILKAEVEKNKCRKKSSAEEAKKDAAQAKAEQTPPTEAQAEARPEKEQGQAEEPLPSAAQQDKDNSSRPQPAAETSQEQPKPSADSSNNQAQPAPETPQGK